MRKAVGIKIGVAMFGIAAMLNGDVLADFCAELVSKDEEQRLKELEW